MEDTFSTRHGYSLAMSLVRAQRATPHQATIRVPEHPAPHTIIPFFGVSHLQFTISPKSCTGSASPHYADQGSNTILPPSPPLSMRAWTSLAAASGSRSITTG